MEADDSQAIRTQLQKILDSDGFPTGSKFARLLAYLVEQSLQGNAVKESTVAVDFYHRKLDPQGDGQSKPSFVRVDCLKLRDLLTQYYLHAGWQDDLLIEIPKNTYQPKFTFRSGKPVHLGQTVNESALSSVPDGKRLEENLWRSVIEVNGPLEELLLVYPKIAAAVQQGSRSAQAKLLTFRPGSTYIDAFVTADELVSLHGSLRSGHLAAAIGYEVFSVLPAYETYAGLITQRSRSLEVCMTGPIQNDAKRIEGYRLHLDKSATEEPLVIEFGVFRIDSQQQLHRSVFRQIQLPADADSSVWEITPYSAWPLVFAGPVGWIQMFAAHRKEDQQGQGSRRAGSPFDGTFGTGARLFNARIIRPEASDPSDPVDAAAMVSIDDAQFDDATSRFEVHARLQPLEEVAQAMRALKVRASRSEWKPL